MLGRNAEVQTFAETELSPSFAQDRMLDGTPVLLLVTAVCKRAWDLIHCYDVGAVGARKLHMGQAYLLVLCLVGDIVGVQVWIFGWFP